MARLIYPERPQRRVDPFAVAEVAAAVSYLDQAITQIATAQGKLAGLRLTNWFGAAADRHQENLLARITTLDATADALASARSNLASIHSTVMQVVAEDDLRLRTYYAAMHT